ncbi:MAG: nucleotidyltransferase domain-containing protein [Spirochaetales bacterium]|jgi:predicted nucleotidyltransferase|nr:nucleotidyltransferase domain-containing protein [Spirochaetales bacterium]
MGLSKTPLNEFGLSEKSMAIINSIYAKYPQIAKVIVYGSRAMGNYREGSDIDMTIIADGEFTFSDRLHVMNDFDDSMLPYLVDISNFAELQNQDLIDHIRRRGKVLYERQSNID